MLGASGFPSISKNSPFWYRGALMFPPSHAFSLVSPPPAFSGLRSTWGQTLAARDQGEFAKEAPDAVTRQLLGQGQEQVLGLCSETFGKGRKQRWVDNRLCRYRGDLCCKQLLRLQERKHKLKQSSVILIYNVTKQSVWHQTRVLNACVEFTKQGESHVDFIWS